MIKTALISLSISVLFFAGILRTASAQGTNPPLAPGEILRGTFIQERHLKDVPTALYSEGTFTLTPDRGLIWHTIKPIDTTIVLSRGGLLQFTGGTKTQRISASRISAFSELHKIFLSVLSGDRNTLEKIFDVTAKVDQKTWSLSLRPKTLAGAAGMRLLTINGEQVVQLIRIERGESDYDIITFANHIKSVAALSDREEALFDANDKE